MEPGINNSLGHGRSALFFAKMRLRVYPLSMKLHLRVCGKTIGNLQNCIYARNTVKKHYMYAVLRAHRTAEKDCKSQTRNKRSKHTMVGKKNNKKKRFVIKMICNWSAFELSANDRKG